MDLSTLARVKIVLELTVSQHDTLLQQFLTAVSADAEKFMGRHAEQMARTEQYNVDEGQAQIVLKGYPVAASPVAAIKNDTTRAFTGSAISTDNYYLDLTDGIAYFDKIWLQYGKGVIQVVYTGGMATTAAGIVTAFPDVADAVDQITAYRFKRRDELGLSSFSSEGGNISFEKLEEFVKPAYNTLRRHRREGVGYL